MQAKRTEINDLYKTEDGTFLFARKHNEISEYRRKIKMFEDKESEIDSLKDKINKIEDDMSDIKDMLSILIKKVS